MEKYRGKSNTKFNTYLLTEEEVQILSEAIESLDMDYVSPLKISPRAIKVLKALGDQFVNDLIHKRFKGGNDG